MLSKSVPVAITALSLFTLMSCSSMLPWRGEDPSAEVNLAFTLENNLVFLSTVTINDQPGRIFFGSANPHTVLDPVFAAKLHASRYVHHLNTRTTLPFTPVITSLGGVGDALVGADIWGPHAVTIDYRSGLLTWQKEGIHPEFMTIYHFDAQPRIVAEVDGQQMPVIVDTALPDTLVLPRGASAARRRPAHVVVAGIDFGTTDIALGDVAEGRIGNRLLSKFLVSIDYGRRQVGLWRDPRIRM